MASKPEWPASVANHTAKRSLSSWSAWKLVPRRSSSSRRGGGSSSSNNNSNEKEKNSVVLAVAAAAIVSSMTARMMIADPAYHKLRKAMR